MSIETNAIAAVGAAQASQAAPAQASNAAGGAQAAHTNPAAYAAQGPGQVEQGIGAPTAQAASPADAQHFGSMMRAGAPTAVQPGALPAQPIPVVPNATPSPVADVSFTFTRGAGADGAMGQWRDYGHDLNERYTSINAKRQEMLDSLDSMDVTMTMVKLADFSYFASMTLAEYQMDMSFAQAANGVSHSLLKNQEG
ncbi:hypothetical protein KTE26_18790 [Ralstonia mannitolilytica]|uniref:hypothetical protein n=1 Tax=Ralstonia mannitolilytica TaxID=105219 RepID=UPI000CEEA76D|nr:hypothetical protein [Ralstonia mannitolilytica]MBU9580485.1 hypothetical protein [Ralstonia mannitolilytica]